jgi:tight adherence protein B
VTGPVQAAALAGALAAFGFASLAAEVRPAVAARVPRLLAHARASLADVLQPFLLAGAEGLIETDRERLRLQLAAGVASFFVGLAAIGPRVAVLLAFASAWLASRSLGWRRERYRLKLDKGVAGAASAIADALEAGRSVRGALAAAASGIRGPMGIELRRVSRELEVGARTDEALEALRRRSRSRRVDLVVAAVVVQRRSGGSLATLLREIAKVVEEQDRLGDEARAASAQARFTSVVVLSLPLGGLVLAELASPGIVSRMASSPGGAWLLGSALALQVAGLALIRRLSRLEA